MNGADPRKLRDPASLGAFEFAPATLVPCSTGPPDETQNREIAQQMSVADRLRHSHRESHRESHRHRRYVGSVRTPENGASPVYRSPFSTASARFGSNCRSFPDDRIAPR